MGKDYWFWFCQFPQQQAYDLGRDSILSSTWTGDAQTQPPGLGGWSRYLCDWGAVVQFPHGKVAYWVRGWEDGPDQVIQSTDG